MKKTLFLILIASFTALNAMAQEYETGSPASSNFPANDIDKTDYSKIPVVKNIDDYFGDSYRYYFTVGKTRFRAVHIRVDSFPETITIQKYHNKKWYNRIEFETLNHFGDFKLSDVNNDGYLDLVRETHFDAEVYFFNPADNNFIDSVCCEINYDIHLIDSARHIYCDFQEYRGNCENIHSSLYTIKNFKKTILFSVDLVNCDSTGEHIPIKTLVLNKFINSPSGGWEELETIHFKKPLDEDKENYFDNKAFWKKRYKKLLGYE